MLPSRKFGYSFLRSSKKGNHRESLHLTELQTSQKSQNLFWMCHNTLGRWKKKDVFLFFLLWKSPINPRGVWSVEAKQGKGRREWLGTNSIPSVPRFAWHMENDSMPSFQGFCHSNKFRRNSEFKGFKNQDKICPLVRLQRETSCSSREQEGPEKSTKTRWGREEKWKNLQAGIKNDKYSFPQSRLSFSGVHLVS